jgi:hypothetical protein
MASTLWVIDFLFVLARAGVTRFNVHSSGDSGYSVFTVDNTQDQISVGCGLKMTPLMRDCCELCAC